MSSSSVGPSASPYRTLFHPSSAFLLGFAMRLQKMAHADGLWYVTPRNEMSPWLVNSPLHVWCRYEIHTASGPGVMAPASTSILSDTV